MQTHTEEEGKIALIDIMAYYVNNSLLYKQLYLKATQLLPLRSKSVTQVAQF